MNLKTFMHKVGKSQRSGLVRFALFIFIATLFVQLFAATSSVSATPPYTLVPQTTAIPDFQFTIRDGAGVTYTVNQDVGDPNLVYFKNSSGFDCTIVIWGYPKNASDGTTARIADGQAVDDQNCSGNDSGDFEANFGSIDRSVTINGSPTSPGGGDGSSTGGGTADITATCESRNPGLGWLLCQILKASVNVLEGLTIRESTLEGSQGFLGNILNFDLAGNQQDALRTVWSGFRVLANSLFAIIFLLVIYAAATGNGIGPYNLKRLLPRLIISAILVQLSFDISLILLDIFNALGRGASALILAPIPGESYGNFIGNTIGISQLGAFALSILFLILGIIIIAGAIVGILIMGGVFILRNIGLVMLIVLAPIAFALMVMPNTERLFRKWFEWFIQLLALFPIAAVLLASGKLVSYVWIGATEGGGNEEVGEGAVGATLIALFAIYLPYYLGPKLFQFAGGAVGRIGNTAQGMQRNLENREFMQRGKAKYKAKAFERADKVREGIKNPSAGGGTPGFLRKGLGAAASSKYLNTTDKALERYSGRAQRRYDSIQDEEVENSRVMLRNRVAGKSGEEKRDYYRSLVENTKTAESDQLAALREMQIAESDGIGIERALTGKGTASGQPGVSQATWEKFMQKYGGDVHQSFRHLSTGEYKRTASGMQFAPGFEAVAKGSTGQDIVSIKPEAVAGSVAELQDRMNRGDVDAQNALIKLLNEYQLQVKTNPNYSARINADLKNTLEAVIDRMSGGTAPLTPDVQRSVDSINKKQNQVGRQIIV